MWPPISFMQIEMLSYLSKLSLYHFLKNLLWTNIFISKDEPNITLPNNAFLFFKINYKFKLIESIKLHGSYSIINLINYFASSLIGSHSSDSKSYSPLETFSNIFSSVLPLNGGYPHKRMYKITPQLHISHFSSYFLFNTSGAIQ